MHGVACLIYTPSPLNAVAGVAYAWQVAESFHARFGSCPAVLGASIDVWETLGPEGAGLIGTMIGEAWGDRVDVGWLVPRAPWPSHSQFCMAQRMPSPGRGCLR